VIYATRELDAPVADVWAFLAEPFHLPDWWPGYSGVQPDRRGLASGARWQVRRSSSPGLLRKPGGEGLILIRKVDPPFELAWHDVQQKLDIAVALEPAAGRTLATVRVGGPWWRLLPEGARSLPKKALARLATLIQTSGSL
jgi:uncharacterized protein YndB with AHSA1/START domain